MAATSQSLQQQVEELRACCPVLCPSIVPQGYDTQDLFGVAQQLGRAAEEALGAVEQEAAALAQECCVCGCSGRALTGSGSDEDGDDSAELGFTVLTDISFAVKSITLKKAGFACGMCRALRDTGRMVVFAATRVGEGRPESQQLLLELCLHLASVNRAPGEMQSNPEALVVWFQELYSRAYALQVVASNLRGWKAVGPEGAEQPLDLHSGKSLAALAQALLRAGAKKAPSKKKGKKAGEKAKAEGASALAEQQSEGPSPSAGAAGGNAAAGKPAAGKASKAKAPAPAAAAAGNGSGTAGGKRPRADAVGAAAAASAAAAEAAAPVAKKKAKQQHAAGGKAEAGAAKKAARG